MDTTTLGLRLRAARREAGLTQETLARRCGWESASRISMYERDERNPTLPIARQLAAALGLREQWLISGEPPMQPDHEAVPGSEFAPNQRVMIRGIAPMHKDNTFRGTQEIEDVSSPYVIAPTDDPLAYGEEIGGEGAAPALGNGWIAIVEPSKPPVPGEYVRIATENQIGYWQFLYETRAGVTVSAPHDPSIRVTFEHTGIRHICAVGPIVPPSHVRR